MIAENPKVLAQVKAGNALVGQVITKLKAQSEWAQPNPPVIAILLKKCLAAAC